jgi:hypothetical protein
MTATLWLQAFLLALMAVALVLVVFYGATWLLGQPMRFDAIDSDDALYRAIRQHASDAAEHDVRMQPPKDTPNPHAQGSLHASIWQSSYTLSKALYACS